MQEQRSLESTQTNTRTVDNVFREEVSVRSLRPQQPSPKQSNIHVKERTDTRLIFDIEADETSADEDMQTTYRHSERRYFYNQQDGRLTPMEPQQE